MIQHVFGVYRDGVIEATMCFDVPSVDTIVRAGEADITARELLFGFRGHEEFTPTLASFGTVSLESGDASDPDAILCLGCRKLFQPKCPDCELVDEAAVARAIKAYENHGGFRATYRMRAALEAALGTGVPRE